MAEHVRFGIAIATLRGTNAAVDGAASLLRYLDLLEVALKEAMPDVEFTLGEGSGVEVEAASEARRQRLGAETESIARAVRHCGNWVVYEE